MVRLQSHIPYSSQRKSAQRRQEKKYVDQVTPIKNHQPHKDFKCSIRIDCAARTPKKKLMKIMQSPATYKHHLLHWSSFREPETRNSLRIVPFASFCFLSFFFRLFPRLAVRSHWINQHVCNHMRICKMVMVACTPCVYCTIHSEQISRSEPIFVCCVQ